MDFGQKKIRIDIGKEYSDATYEQNSLIHIDEPSIQNRAILAKFSFNCYKRLSHKYDRLDKTLNAKSN